MTATPFSGRSLQEEANDHQDEEYDDEDLRDPHAESRYAPQSGQSGDDSEDEKE
ncbi:hypothetical protein Harman_10570 [Haloarcula mannanilytica]|uniref:Uncharacterized protein n=1 Tax=Haloarcula mannanilytica TaxID=2509225 RepID=A0A4C2EFJ5_9EURY|nr:hypothetical protein Harman_10570 [Haloarcula mannanilytica]